MQKKLLYVAILVVLFFLSGLPASGKITQENRAKEKNSINQNKENSTRISQPISSKEVKKLYKVSDTLYRGAQPSEEGIFELKKLGIKTLINLRTDSDEDAERLNGVELACESIPISWNPFRSPKDADVVKFLQMATDPSKQPVFVHCRQGVDRTGLMIAAYRIVIQGWNKDEALAEMKQIGFHNRYGKYEKYLRNMDINKIKEQIKNSNSN